MRRRFNAFTLVELLVVIGIIAILTAILMPSLNRARDAALRVRCAGNLQQWGVGLTNYVIDNRGAMPLTWGPFFGGRYPYHYRVRTAGPDAFVSPIAYPGVISVEMMQPYVKGMFGDLAVGATTPRRLEGVWRCPASFSDLDTRNGANMWDTNGFVYGDYSYFGRSDLWDSANMTNPEEIVRNKPDAPRIWMSDVIFRWGSSPPVKWSYNHRRRGMGNASHVLGDVGAPQLTGLNQLCGDGHVVWKDGAKFTFTEVGPPIAGPGSHFVRGGGIDAFIY